MLELAQRQQKVQLQRKNTLLICTITLVLLVVFVGVIAVIERSVVIGRGHEYYDKKEYERAIIDYTEAIRLNPKDAIVYNNRGAAYYNKKEYEHAIIDYTEAIRLDSKYATAYYNRGYAYKAKGDSAQAHADFAEAERLGW
ncbi:hypothetical protein PilKf_00462 [Pillotina sp. SPG140]